MGLTVSEEALLRIAVAADGDARRALNLLDLAAGVARAAQPDVSAIAGDTIDQVVAGGWRRFDRGGDIFHDQIS